MIGIQIAGEYLDLPPDLELDVEQANPFLQLQDEILGEFSYPFEVAATPTNIRLLNYAAVIERKVTNTGIDAVVYDNGILWKRGKIKIEKSSLNLNRIADGRISCYFLSGISSFMQDIKDKRLREADYDGTRSFDWDAYATDITVPDPGFWAHIRKVMYASPGYGVSGFDYAFFPVKNTEWPGRGDIDLMNKVYWNMPTSAEFFIPGYFDVVNFDLNRIVPFPYLKYVMIKAIEFCGWKLSGDMMNYLDFKKIVMLNFRAIDWSYLKHAGGSSMEVERDPVEFNLADHLPDVTITEFLIALKNRFGWWYDFDRASKTVSIRELNEIASGETKDMTLRSSPLVVKTINQQRKIYALRNSFSTEIGNGAPDFDAVSFQGNVDELTDLPAAAEALFGQVYLVIAENNFYICQQNEDTEAWQWILYTYNIFDYEPDNYTDEITTSATTVGNEYYNAYLDFIPRADVPGQWFGRTEESEAVDHGIMLVFNHGVLPNKAGEDFPYASHHNYSSDFANVSLWSLSFEAKEAGGSPEVGLYHRNWKKLLDLLQAQEEAEVTLYLSRADHLKLSFSDKLIIRNTRWFIKNIKTKLPFKGSVALQLVRI
jgi:hypothetical protein